MKFGIIGAGMIGRFHAKAITDMTGDTAVGGLGKVSRRYAPFFMGLGLTSQ